MAGTLKDNCTNMTCVGTDADDLSSATTLANVSNVSFAVGAVGAVVGVIGLFVHGGGDSSEQAAVSVIPVGDAGAGLRVRF